MFGEYLKRLISFIVAPTEGLFIASPPAFDGLHDDIKLFVVRCLYQKLLKKLQYQSEREPTIACS